MGFLRQNSKFDLNFRPVSDIIGNVKCRCDGMVDVTDSKASKSGSMNSGKILDFSRLLSYNEIWLL